MAKRERLEILKDTLKIIQEHKNSIKPTVLLRKSKMSSLRFKEYYNELVAGDFVKEISNDKDERLIALTDKGYKFLDKYKLIVNFIEEFDL